MRFLDNMVYAAQYPLVLKDMLKELRYAFIWHDTKEGIEWCRDLGTLSPGGYAVGYDYLYVMTRILEELRPKAVLDIGLGISSTLISRYFSYYKIPDAVHDIVEHDQGWIEFYLKRHHMSESSNIIKKELISSESKWGGGIHYEYRSFEKNIITKKYDVISVDGPSGSQRHSRNDIVKVLPEILADDFVIVQDDANRKGEKETTKEITKCLRKHGIDYETRVYKGIPHVRVIVSKGYQYVCTF